MHQVKNNNDPFSLLTVRYQLNNTFVLTPSLYCRVFYDTFKNGHFEDCLKILHYTEI